MQSEVPLTLILSPLRAGRGELEHTCLGSLFGDPDTVPPKVPLSLRKRERVRVRVRLDCMDTVKAWDAYLQAAQGQEAEQSAETDTLSNPSRKRNRPVSSQHF